MGATHASHGLTREGQPRVVSGRLHAHRPDPAFHTRAYFDGCSSAEYTSVVRSLSKFFRSGSPHLSRTCIMLTTTTSLLGSTQKFVPAAPPHPNVPRPPKVPAFAASRVTPTSTPNPTPVWAEKASGLARISSDS